MAALIQPLLSAVWQGSRRASGLSALPDRTATPVRGQGTNCRTRYLPLGGDSCVFIRNFACPNAEYNFFGYFWYLVPREALVEERGFWQSLHHDVTDALRSRFFI
jgi:hypothetical protein